MLINDKQRHFLDSAVRLKNQTSFTNATTRNINDHKELWILLKMILSLVVKVIKE